MTLPCDWVIEFRSLEGESCYVRATSPNGKEVVANANDWTMLAEGAYKGCQGNVRAGKMDPRPLESCVKRVEKIMGTEHYPRITVRIRNIHTNEEISGELFNA